MVAESSSFETIELREQLPLSEGVSFDPDNVTLHGAYSDEISAYRAKKLWIETLENCFLLERDHDFTVRVRSGLDDGHFLLICEFNTACARYAFWRLTNNQAPEAQYIIETAHIPVCDSRQEDILRAPDMRSIYGEPCVLRGESSEQRKHAFSELLQRIIGKFKG